ncbi:hypothetical protein [Candidatus Phytoplasma pini]|uniref:Uncharacterized protein n=1 Tax=Candidatus Phytoplasma pini TaxID=267362 RepID=A0A559KIZ1_9MOLU|nr:hypothetical protein [Candidatus Phytoplasma pini]TVY12100.1 hypothetical protein MDPP_00365 [Candidatus Phytoplasma pini]
MNGNYNFNNNSRRNYYNRIRRYMKEEMLLAFVGIGVVIVMVLVFFFGTAHINSHQFKGFLTIDIPTRSVGIREKYYYTDPATKLKKFGGSLVKVNGEFSKDYYSEAVESGNPIQINKPILK